MQLTGAAPEVDAGWRFVLATAPLALVAGSAAFKAIDWLPRDDRSASSRGCRTCGAPARLVDRIPILTWLMRRGRCYSCRSRLPGTAPFVEAVNCALWVLLAVLFGPSPRTLALMLFVTALLMLSLIDFEHYLLPDAITLPGIVAGVGATWLPGWPVSLIDSTLSAAIGYFAMMALATAAELYYGEEALGQGDWKMVAMIGAFLGSTKLLFVVLVANATGAAVGLLLVAALGEAGRQKLPLGTFLGASGVLFVFI
jgi:leader peptidase (prepilin peptidase)/N-methyltransferase